MSAPNLCPDCKEPLAVCECDDTETVAIPYCPSCHDETAVYCMECSYDFVGCDCVSSGNSWYCMRCDSDFEFDIHDLTGIEEEENQEPVFDRPDQGIWQDPEDLKWYYDDGTEVKCRCYKPKLVVCHACNVSRASVTSRWLPWIDKTFEMKSAGHSYSSGYAAAYGYGYGSWTSIDGCDHKMAQVKINDLTIYASSLNDTRVDDIPDWGLYADWTWTPWWRNEHIAWKDYGLPTDYEIAAQQICFAYDIAKSGKRVEIGCIGGHGRTGTILCCMAILEGMSPEEAMKHVETTYCSKVVETWEQQWWIKWFEAHIKGQEAPPKPPPPPSAKAPSITTTTTTGVPLDVQYCTVSEHFEMFKVGATACKWSSCASFEFDLKSYLRGKGNTTSYASVADIADAVLGKKKDQNRK